MLRTTQKYLLRPCEIDISRTISFKEVQMRHRKPTNRKKDKKIFHATGATTKKINIAPKPMRGGIRL